MDRSQKHVEFDETEAPTDAEPNGEAEPIDNGGEVEEEQEEEEETVCLALSCEPLDNFRSSLDQRGSHCRIRRE